MDWKQAAIDDLKKYNAQKQSLINIQQRISALKIKNESIKSRVTDSTPVQGGGCQTEENLLNNIVERERLKLTYAATKRLVTLVEKGLSELSDDEKYVLEMFYIAPEKGNVDRLMDEISVEKSQVYRIKDAALYKYTLRMYGLTDY
ncbi:MAG: hypothetical protein Q8865_05415 [Bacillota bacterium]|nr:hypothetical protein [Bacillota bacterium]